MPPNFSLEPAADGLLFAAAAGYSLLPGFVGSQSQAAAAQFRVRPLNHSPWTPPTYKQSASGLFPRRLGKFTRVLRQ